MPMRVVRVLAWLWASLVLVLSLSPPRYRMVTAAPHDLEHFAAFTLFGLMFSLGYPEKRPKVAVIGTAVITAIEFAQLVVPGRHAYFADFVLNVLGFYVGIASARMPLGASLK
jgi:VanZ family protein